MRVKLHHYRLPGFAENVEMVGAVLDISQETRTPSLGRQHRHEVPMNEREWEKKLHQEGFGNIFVCRDRPNAYYPEHTHAGTTAHLVLEGEIIITSEGTSEGTTRTFRAGERFDVPANTVHSARIGPAGCRYMVGEK